MRAPPVRSGQRLTVSKSKNVNTVNSITGTVVRLDTTNLIYNVSFIYILD